MSRRAVALEGLANGRDLGGLPVELEQEPVAVPDDLTAVHVDLDGLEHRAFWADYWDNGLSGTPLYSPSHLAALPESLLARLTAAEATAIRTWRSSAPGQRT